MSQVAVSFQSDIELTVTRFSVEERISAAFSIQLEALGVPDIDPRALVGRGASFALVGRGGRRAWTGVCARIAQTHRTGELASYSVTLAPALWLLSRRRNHRIFQHLSAPEAARALLADWGITPVERLAADRYPRLEYRVQYGETDYNFLRRQLAEAGISFHFELGEASPGVEETKLVLTDAPERGEVRPAPLPFLPESGLGDAQDHISHLTITTEVRPGRVVLRDHDPRRPTYPLVGQFESSAQPEALLEEYVYEPGAAAVESPADGSTPVADKPVAYRQPDGAASAQARILGESLRPGGLTVHFMTSVVDLHAGSVLAVSGHPHPIISGPKGLLAVEVGISGEVQGEWSTSGVAVPASEPFRPPHAEAARPTDHTAEVDVFASHYVPQKPRAVGIESAIVVGPRGEEIHTDEHGRVRVQFHWDREGRWDDHSSCWVRVSQAWAGAGYGATFLPRVGQEVLIAFVGGDPDLPVIVGRVHAPTIPHAESLPEHKTRSGIRSSSSPGGGGYNEILLEDAKGQELLAFRAERDLESRAGRVDTTVAGEAVRLFIAGSQTGIEISKGRIVLTTGEATLVLEGGEITAHGVKNLATPPWKEGGSDKPHPVIATERAAAPQPVKPREPVKLPLAPSPPGKSGDACVKLGVNKKFKASILEASRRTGVAPHAIAAMIDAEAAKTPAGQWDPASQATTSSARGLTQFLNGTWKQMALTKGSLLNESATEAGYVVKEGKGFGVANGKLDELLGMRTDPRLSIVTGAEYAKGNLDVLERAGFITDATTDDEKARLAYLAHHEGPQGAKDFLNGTIPEGRAAELLAGNAGKKTAAALTEKYGSAREAYKHWLNAYIDKKIVPGRYRCESEQVDGDEAAGGARS